MFTYTNETTIYINSILKIQSGAQHLQGTLKIVEHFDIFKESEEMDVCAQAVSRGTYCTSLERNYN